LKGASAVIDKDFASCLLAEELDADFLIILTAVEKAAIRYGTKEQQWLTDITVSEAEKYIAEGHFAPGSMLRSSSRRALRIEEAEPRSHPSLKGADSQGRKTDKEYIGNGIYPPYATFFERGILLWGGTILTRR
jgi:hypothetical protein